MKQEIATKSFLSENLIKKLPDKKVHNAIKLQVVQTIIQLNETFQSDPSLKPISEAYSKVSREFPQYLPPSKPEKKKISDKEKGKEDDELQRVLKLSLQEYEREQSLKTYQKNKPLPPTGESKQDSPTPEPTVATVSKVRALYDLISYEPDELSFKKGDVISVIESVYRDWWRGMLTNGKIGIFPLNYVTPIVNKTPQELQKEVEAENRVLDEAKKVDRMLSLLASPNPDENELTRLYNDIIPLRPQLGKIIDKYGVRKEEMFALNNQLNQEVKEYNELMDSTIASRTNNYSIATPYPTGQFGVVRGGGAVPHDGGISHQGSEMRQSSQQSLQMHQSNHQSNPPHVPEMTTGPQQSSYINDYNQAAPQNPQFYLQSQSQFAPPPPPQHDTPRQYSNSNSNEPPATTFQQYTPQQQQHQQYLQQQPTSTGFGNSREPQFLNIQNFPEIGPR
jgi:signal transducing adaptor molecule